MEKLKYRCLFPSRIWESVDCLGSLDKVEYGLYSTIRIFNDYASWNLLAIIILSFVTIFVYSFYIIYFLYSIISLFNSDYFYLMENILLINKRFKVIYSFKIISEVYQNYIHDLKLVSFNCKTKVYDFIVFVKLKFNSISKV